MSKIAKNMKNGIKFPTSRITCYAVDKGESIEEKMRRVTENNEPIEDTAPLNYTDRKDGVLPQYDIRTDRWEIARQAMDKVNASVIAAREPKPTKEEVEKNIPQNIEGKPVTPIAEA